MHACAARAGAGGDAVPLPGQLPPAHAAFRQHVACPAHDLLASWLPPRLRQCHKHEHHLMLISSVPGGVASPRRGAELRWPVAYGAP
eukprot:6870889-Prymnesium_polylepis.1